PLSWCVARVPVRTLTLDVFTGRVDELHDGNDIGGGRVHLLAAGWAGVEGSVLAHARHPTAGLLDSFAAQVVGDIRDGFVLRILTLDDARAWHKGEDEEQRQWFEFPEPAPFENVVAAIEPPTSERREESLVAEQRVDGAGDGAAVRGRATGRHPRDVP